MKIRKRNKLVCGVGINDADYSVKSIVNGRQVTCPHYQKWCNMLKRCYSAKYHARRPTYVVCTVCDEWLYFMAFRAWMVTQDWNGKELEKDIINPDNKVYCPEWCVFVTPNTNTFIIDCGASRGAWPIGVSWFKRDSKFRAYCRNPFTKKLEHLGYFTNPDQAHEAWKKRKHELALQLAELQSDGRVKIALQTRFVGQHQ